MDIARYLVAFVALYGFGGLIADGIVPSTARQHLFNPAWPPHARFHNGQTMLLGVVNGTLALVVLFGFRPLTLPLFLVATGIAAAYGGALALAPLFPGTACYDPECEATATRPLGISPQQWLSYALCGLLGLALILALTLR